MATYEALWLTHLSSTQDLLFVTDACISEETVIPSSVDGGLDIILQWPETAIGQTVTLECPCANVSLGIQNNATRYCGGDFDTGGMWSSPEQDACNLTEIARTLCLIVDVSQRS